MRRSRTITAGLALAAAAAVGVTVAAATGSPTSSARPARPAATASPAAAATVRTTLATVGGRIEPILVNAHGLPLYYYRPDAATSSLVTAGLARLWPPLTSTAPVTAGLTGKITVVRDSHGHQVAYNDHLLYTFVYDTAGRVTGQGVQNFFVATLSLTPLTGSPAPGRTTQPAPSGGYGY